AEICFSLDRSLKVTYWGKTLGQISRIPPDRAVGRYVEELYTLFPRRERLVNLISEVFRTEKVVRTTYKYSKKIYDFNMYPFSDGVMVIALCKSQDSRFQFSYSELWERELKNTIQTIHNDLGQYVAALSLHCAELEFKVKSGSVISCEEISNINKICSGTSDSLRNLMQSILWRAGNEVPDANIIQCVCTTIEKSFGVVIDVQTQKNPFPSGIFEREHIIKFIQEALLNAAKHSGSHSISLSIDHNERYLIYSICDKGHGFDVTGERNGMGLKMMQFNADELAGEMKITSGVTGTTVTLLIPRY
ncbi:MAG TPA: ATP-binding protein, partial [Chitinispirillaceae bacterium]|nr:ATP-binding protein [Chitinispirillaceae bacterium]